MRKAVTPAATVKEVRVRRHRWKSVEPGDRIVKRPGETAPVKIS
jgi:hypothetical protein